VAGAANDGGEDGAGSVITSETGLAHTGSVINNKSLNFVTHDKKKKKERESKFDLKAKMFFLKITFEFEIIQ
jgi:hypothetical protein